jgi:hypothetical protein
MRQVTWLVGAVLGILALCHFGRAAEPSSEEANAYVKKITAWHGQLNQAGREFGKALNPALAGKSEDLLTLNKSFREMVRAYGTVFKETKSFKVPDHPALKALAAVNDRFMDMQLEALADMVPKFLDIAEDGKLDAEAKSKQIQEILMKGDERERALGARVREQIAEVRQVFKIAD